MSTISPVGIDPRGPRFAALITAVVLAVIALTGSVWLLAVQVGLFGLGTAAGVQKTPHAWLYRRFVRPRLPAPTDLEDPAPPRFAQGVGLAVTGVALVLALAGVAGAVLVGSLLAFVAAFLNGAFGFCLGCELYVLLQRLRGQTRPA